MTSGINLKITEHGFAGDSDKQAMADLVRKFPEENSHVVDLPYRLSSWAFDFPENIRLWMNENGRLIAWVVLQVPFWTIDYCCNPEFNRELHPQILKWADEQARKIANTESGHPSWYVTVPEGQTDRIRDLEQAGFASQSNVGENSWSQVLMKHSLQIPTGEFLPDGFHIRPLNGVDEVEAYVNIHRSVFESRNMTIEWRKRTLERTEYIPELDLVVVAPHGELAAFCICWLAQDANGDIAGQIEPLGVLAEFRKLGLGRAILLEGLKRMHSKGAKSIYVQTESHRNAAFRLYESVGFCVIQDILMYRKDYDSAG